MQPAGSAEGVSAASAAAAQRPQRRRLGAGLQADRSTVCSWVAWPISSTAAPAPQSRPATMLARATLAGTPSALTSRPIGRGSSLIARPGQQAAQRSPAGVGGRVCLNCALLPPGVPVLLGRWGSRPQTPMRRCAAPASALPRGAAVTACPPPAIAGCPQVPRASYGGQQQFGGQQQPGQGLYPPIYQSERRLGCAAVCLAMPTSRCPPHRAAT